MKLWEQWAEEAWKQDRLQYIKNEDNYRIGFLAGLKKAPGALGGDSIDLEADMKEILEREGEE